MQEAWELTAAHREDLARHPVIPQAAPAVLDRPRPGLSVMEMLQGAQAAGSDSSLSAKRQQNARQQLARQSHHTLRVYCVTALNDKGRRVVKKNDRYEEIEIRNHMTLREALALLFHRQSDIAEMDNWLCKALIDSTFGNEPLDIDSTSADQFSEIVLYRKAG